jgi:glycosyltransferase involved in cell wall biosynthesis
MRIAQIAPLIETVPPELYGGTERVVAALCNALVAAGHDVTLFAARGSETLAELVESSPWPLRSRLSRKELIEVAPHLHLRMLEEAYRQADRFDVIHSHVDLWTLPFVRSAMAPTVLTLHGRLDREDAQRVLPLHPGVPLVSISAHQRHPVQHLGLNWVGTVHNGLDLASYRSRLVPAGEHLAFVGRIHHEKRPDLAVEIARRTGRQLRVGAKVDPTDVTYFERDISPLFESNDVVFEGEIDEAAKPAFFSSAAATLFPSDWPEPFGLVMIESMAAGTPVIALRRGSVPEVIVDGVTGWICDSVDEMVDAVGRLGELDREACIAHAATFNAAAMAAGYEQVYERVIADWTPATGSITSTL